MASLTFEVHWRRRSERECLGVSSNPCYEIEQERKNKSKTHHDVDVGVLPELVELSEQGVDSPNPVRRLSALDALLPRHCQRLDLVDQDEDEALLSPRVQIQRELRQVPDLLEQLGNQLPAARDDGRR